MALEIVVVGMGYVGIPAAALFADVEGFYVTGVQRKSKRSGWKIDYLNEGKCPIGGSEPGLQELIKKVVKNNKFRVTDDVSVYSNADVILIDVQTPVDKNQLPQYDSLKEVCQAVGKRMKSGVMIIIESTVAPGTSNYIVKPILEGASDIRAGEDFNLVYSYERVMVGRLLHNMVNMPRIIGGFTHRCAQRGVRLYQNIVKAELYSTDCLTAEMAKVTENTYRDVNVAFANEIALICESLGVNVHEVRQLVNSLPFDSSDPAKNPYRMMHMPGAGVGGHCLPKDPWLLKYGLDVYGKRRFTPEIILNSRKVNDFMPHHTVKLIEEVLTEKGLRLQDAKICILGLAFLPNSDDTRNTPSLKVYNLLKNTCKEIIIHDPFVRRFEGVLLTDSLEDALNGKDCVVIMTSHKEYLNLQLSQIKKALNTYAIVDGRNLLNAKECLDAGFSYRGIGIGRASLGEGTHRMFDCISS